MNRPISSLEEEIQKLMAYVCGRFVNGLIAFRSTGQQGNFPLAHKKLFDLTGTACVKYKNLPGGNGLLPGFRKKTMAPAFFDADLHWDTPVDEPGRRPPANTAWNCCPTAQLPFHNKCPACRPNQQWWKPVMRLRMTDRTDPGGRTYGHRHLLHGRGLADANGGPTDSGGRFGAFFDDREYFQLF